MTHISRFIGTRWLTIVITVAVTVVAGTAAAKYSPWSSVVSKLLAGQSNEHAAGSPSRAGHDHESDGQAAHAHGEASHGEASHGHDDHGHDDHGHDDHGHDDHGHDDHNALELSQIGWKNIGLRTGVIKPKNYVKTVSVPAMVVERAGRSQVEITAPLTGIVQRVYVIEGESIEPGQPLFDLRLTHEDLVTAQRNFLQSAQELDVIDREIDRLRSVGDGVIAGRHILEQQYAQQKIEAAMHAQRQGLLLHGLNDQQMDKILATRQLLPSLTVMAPPFDLHADNQGISHQYHVQRILVKRGQSVTAGEPLALLGDHGLLYVEGQAFEDDASRLVQAAREGWNLDVGEVGKHRTDKTSPLQLKVFYVADQVDRESRALRFYLSLPNVLLRDEVVVGHRFVAWKYRPGQRMEVKIPIGQPWLNQIVLPPEAIVDEGAETFVFEQNGNHFDRVPVHVVYRDKDAIVIDNDGTLDGSTVAMSGAYQMHLAIKNKAGGGVDPHAGHQH